MILAKKLLRGAGADAVFDGSITSPNHPNLLAFYTMDNISGTTLFDESPNSNNSIIALATTITGHIGDALDFSPSVAANAESSSLTGDGIESICLWLNHTTTSAEFLFQIGSTTPNDLTGAIHIAVNSGAIVGAVNVRIEKTGTGVALNGTTIDLSLNDGNWHFIVAVYDKNEGLLANQLKIWTDSVQRTLTHFGTETDLTAVDSVSESMVLGQRATELGSYTGGLDHFRRFQGLALDQTDVDALWNSGVGA